jgi:hypothetical protein
MATEVQAQRLGRLVSGEGPILPDVVRSEFTKFRSVRSTYATMAAVFVAAAALGPVQCALYASNYPNVDAHEKAKFSATQLSLNGIQLAQLAIGVLGVLLITSEYTTGLIRATFAAVPQRRTVMAAKAIVFTVATLIVSEIAGRPGRILHLRRDRALSRSGSAQAPRCLNKGPTLGPRIDDTTHFRLLA